MRLRFGVGIYRNCFRYIGCLSLAVESCFDHSVLSRCNGLLDFVGNGASTGTSCIGNDQRLIAGVFELPRNFNYASFFNFSEVLRSRVEPLKTRVIRTVCHYYSVERIQGSFFICRRFIGACARKKDGSRKNQKQVFHDSFFADANVNENSC